MTTELWPAQDPDPAAAPDQVWLLGLIAEHGGIRPRDAIRLAAELGAGTSAVRRRWRELLRAGLVRSDPDPDDRRGAVWRLATARRVARQRPAGRPNGPRARRCPRPTAQTATETEQRRTNDLSTTPPRHQRRTAGTHRRP